MGKQSYHELKKRVEELEKIEFEYKKVDKALSHRIEFIELISILSTTFINLSIEETDNEIVNALELIGTFSNVDGSYVFLLSEDKTKVTNTYKWCAKEIKTKLKKPKELPIEKLPWLMNRLKNFKNTYIPRVSDLPEEAKAEKKILKSQNIKSLVVVPMEYGGSLVGFLGLDSIQSEKIWEEEIIPLIKIIGNIFINALECKHGRENLKNSEERLKTLFQYAPDPYYLSDLKGNIVDVNIAVLELTGYKREELVGKNFRKLKLIPKEQFTKINKILEKNIKGKPAGPDEIALIHKNGRQITIGMRTFPIKIKNLDLILGIAHDITERKRSEEALRQSEEKLKKHQEHLE